MDAAPQIANTTHLQQWVDRLNDGDDDARERLLNAANGRLRVLAQRMLRHDRLRRWEQTDDVLQLAMLQLHRELNRVQPATAREFLKFAAFQTRRVLTQLARHHYGPHGHAAHHASRPDAGTRSGDSSRDTPSSAPSPDQMAAQLDRWQQLHEQVDRLPDDEREVVDLLYFHGLSQDDVANLLDLSVRTVQRRWQSARLRLYERLKGELSLP